MECRIKWLPFPCRFPQPMLEPPISQSTHWPPQQLSVLAFLLTHSCCCLTLTHCGSSCICFFYYHSLVSLLKYFCFGFDLVEGIVLHFMLYSCRVCMPCSLADMFFFFYLESLFESCEDACPIGPLETDFSI